MQNQQMQKFKVVVLGEQSVGKTAILTRFMYDTFDNTYQATIGIDYFAKTIYTPERTVKIQLWDTAGQERFRSLIPSYIRDSSAALVTFDLTNVHSFKSTLTWAKDARAERGDKLRLILVGNKSDLEDRKVSLEEAEQMAHEIDAVYIEVSAKTGHNIKTLFRKVVEILPNVTVPAVTEKIQLQSSPALGSVGSYCNC